MADRILHKRNLNAGNNPTTSSLELGELAINVADGKLFLRQSGSTVDQVVTVGLSSSYASTASYYTETDPVFVAKSGSFATTGSNTFNGDQTISGSLFVYDTAYSVLNIDTQTRNLYDSIAGQSINWDFRYLYAFDGVSVSVDWYQGQLWSAYDPNTLPYYVSLDWNQRTLGDSNNITSVDWQQRKLYYSSGGTILDWSAGYLYSLGSPNGPLSINWPQRHLVGTDGTSIILNWGTNPYFSGSLHGTASWATNAVTASFITTAQTASYVLNAVSSSFSSTSSFLNTLNQDLTFNGNLTLNGTASISYLNVIYETASVIYSSGSNQFGDAVNDTQTLIGQTIVSGSLNVTGSANLPSITGSLFGTSSWSLNAITSSYVQTAQTASYILNAVSASFATSSSYATTSSYALTAQTLLGSVVSSSYSDTASYVNPLQQAVLITGSLNISGSIYNPNSIHFYTTASGVTQVGQLGWDDGYGTLDLMLKGGNVNVELGQENVVLVYNDSGTTLNKGEIVFVSGSQGNRPSVNRAIATVDGYSVTTLGFAAESITSGAEGYVTTFGFINNIDTSGTIGGTPVWLSPTVAGGWTTTKPQAPNHTVLLGYIVRVHPSVGSIFVHISNGWEIDELHDVRIVSASAGDLLVRSGSLWINTNQLSGSYAITGSLTATSFTGSLQGTATTASYVQTAQTASYVLQAVSSSFATTSSYAVSASYAPDTTFPYTGSAQITGSLIVTGSIRNFVGSNIALNTEQYALYANNGISTVRWDSALLADKTNATSIDWQQRLAKNSSGITTIDWGNYGLLYDSKTAVDWKLKTLYDSATSSSINWQSRTLYDSATSSSINWQSRTLLNSTQIVSVDYETGQTKDASGRLSIDYNVTRSLYDNTPTISVNWQGRSLYDVHSTASIDWNTRVLLDSSGTAILYYDPIANIGRTVQFSYHLNQVSNGNQGEALIAGAVASAALNSTGELIAYDTNIDPTTLRGELCSLGEDGIWYTTDQASISGSAMLSICVEPYNKGVMMTEGTITVVTASGYTDIPFVEGTSFYGKPVYMRSGSLGGLSTTKPTSGYVRVVGHMYYNSTSSTDYWLMKFRPSNDWYQI